MKILNVTRSTMTGYIQLAEADRYSEVDGKERFLLKYRDAWQNKPTSSDAVNHRQRVEFRSETYDPINSTVTYEYSFQCDPSYEHITPKQTIGQWFDGKNTYPFGFMRLEQGKLDFLRNYYVNGKSEGQRYNLPSFLPYGENHFKVTFKLVKGVAKGYVKVELNGNVDLELINCSLLSDNAADLHFKYGLYMSDIDDWDAANPGKPTPDLIAYYWGVKRTVVGSAVEPKPVPTEPKPVEAEPPKDTPPPVVVAPPLVVDDQDALDVLNDVMVQIQSIQSALSKLKATANRLEREIKD